MVSVQNVNNNLFHVNFKADQRQQSRQSDPPMLVRQQQGQTQADRFEKERKKQKARNAFMTALSVISTLAIATFAVMSIGGMRTSSQDKAIIREIRARLKNVKDPAIKQQIEGELAMNSYERNLTRAQNLLKLDELAQDNSKRSKIDIKALRERLDKKIIGVDSAKNEFEKALGAINYDIEHGLSDGKPIVILFDGSPGTCKTTLVKEFADNTGMYYKKIPCGGINDAQSIIGFRRTYVGAQAGAFAEAQVESGTKRVCYCLDEIDRVSKKEVLDALLAPFDNQAIFIDQYYGAKIDLSQSVFAMTTNDFTRLPKALKERVRIIHIKDYDRAQKIKMAKAQLENHIKDHKLAEYIDVVDDKIYEKIADTTNDGGGRQTMKLVEELVEDLKVLVNKEEVSTQKKVKINNEFLDKIKLGEKLMEADKLEAERALDATWHAQNL